MGTENGIIEKGGGLTGWPNDIGGWGGRDGGKDGV